MNTGEVRVERRLCNTFRAFLWSSQLGTAHLPTYVKALHRPGKYAEGAEEIINDAHIGMEIVPVPMSRKILNSWRIGKSSKKHSVTLVGQYFLID